MIKVENIQTWGFEHAVRGMRNPMNSWSKSDSKFGVFNLPGYEASGDPNCENCEIKSYVNIGPNDLDLMKRLYKAGSEHRKYLRQIFIVMDITAPLYWWKEFDTYKVGTVANSCSTMHKIAAKEFTLDDFSHEHLINEWMEYYNPSTLNQKIIGCLNEARKKFLETKDKVYWWQMIQLLPSSYNQRRTVTMNYENAITMIKQRTGHKLDEWNEFVKVLHDLPYIAEITEG